MDQSLKGLSQVQQNDCRERINRLHWRDVHSLPTSQRNLENPHSNFTRNAGEIFFIEGEEILA
jgi:hypothetical protein